MINKVVKKGLGKGLGALIANDSTEENNGVLELRINEIEPNADQPRKSFDDEKLLNLSESIKQHGIIQPIIVKKDNNTYTIIAGERRWRAAKLAGLTRVPVLVKDFTNKQVMEIALIENLQREDLNPIEEADAYQRLMSEFELTQEQISETLGKSRPAIANTLRLLALPSTIKQYVISGDLSSGHARTLVTIEDEKIQAAAAKYIIDNKLSVRETENYIKKLSRTDERISKDQNIELIQLEEKLKNILGTKVKLVANKNKGKITIEYFSNDELDRLIEFFTKSVKKVTS
jgi:ParB family chromosome partitioning protein